VSRLRRPYGQSPHGLSGRRRPVGALELVDDRFEKLASELRASRPVASAALRERVASLGAVEPAGPRWPFRLPSRRIVLGLAGAALLASFVAAGVTSHRRSGDRLSAQIPKTTTVHHGGVPSGGRALESTPLGPAAKAPMLSTLAPNRSRLQRYDATLRLRVKDVDALSNGARRAMNLTRSLGGYVGSVDYATRGGKRGGATLVLRVPVANIQTALGELTRDDPSPADRDSRCHPPRGSRVEADREARARAGIGHA
jgi:hypothetical protein